jgi:hypothetical protein
MNRNLGIGILVICFSSSAVNLVRATEVFQVSPIIVQPEKINQTMVHYRDLIALTEDVEAMKGVGRVALPPIIVNAPDNQQVVSDEQAKDDAIRWLNQVVVVAKKKAEYYRLTSQQDRLTMEQVQEEGQQTVARLGVRLSQKQQQVDLLKSELEGQITAVKTAIQSEKETQAQSDALRQRLAGQQNKNVPSDQMALMASDDQKQIAYLNAQLQEKEAQVVKIKKEMYDLQELMSAKDMGLQAKNLSLSVELALARQKLNGIPGSDEINFLRTGLKAAAAQLKQKDEMILRLKAQLKNVDENNNAFSKDDRLREKLKQALDKIDEQGRMINRLVQKLQDAGQSVNLAQYFAKP